jgi:hypothetical protein
MHCFYYFHFLKLMYCFVVNWKYQTMFKMDSIARHAAVRTCQKNPKKWALAHRSFSYFFFLVCLSSELQIFYFSILFLQKENGLFVCLLSKLYNIYNGLECYNKRGFISISFNRLNRFNRFSILLGSCRLLGYLFRVSLN